MADSMRDIKSRIQSVNSTKQITHAMQLVASAKLRKTRDKADARRAYTKHIIETMHVIANGLASDVQNVFLNPTSSDCDLYIVISSDKGLAGGFNSNVLKFAEQQMHNSKNPAVCAVGRKAVEYFTRRKYNILGSYVGQSEDPNLTLARSIGSAATTLFTEQKVNNVYIVYNRFASILSQVPEIIKLLPLTSEEMKTEDKVDTVTYTEGMSLDNDKIKKLNQNILFEPNAEYLADYLIPKYFDNAIYGALLESAAGELAARRMAMENATDNANEIIDGLTLKYNRVRQTAITQEITEIVSGADAIS